LSNEMLQRLLKCTPHLGIDVEVTAASTARREQVS
jgi:hypothetical protein